MLDRPQAPRLLDRLHERIRAKHYSRRTGEAYASWCRAFIVFCGRRHPATVGAAEVTAFPSHLAVQRRVAASTQNQALAALLFLYREVLGVELPWLDDVVRAKRPARLPVVLTPDEVGRILDRMAGAPRLMAVLMYAQASASSRAFVCG